MDITDAVLDKALENMLMADIPKRRPGRHRFPETCDTPDCYKHHCTNPIHEGSWIADDEPVIEDKAGLPNPVQSAIQQLRLVDCPAHATALREWWKNHIQIKEKPVCSSPDSLTNEEMDAIAARCADKVLKAMPKPLPPPWPDANERAKEREHEATLHMREIDLGNRKNDRLHSTLCDLVLAVAVIGLLATLVGFIAYQIRACNMPAPKPPVIQPFIPS